MQAQLSKLAGLLGFDDPERLPWEELRYAHSARLRAMLVESGAAPSTVNVALSVLRGVLKEAWRLGLMTGEDYQRAIDLQPVKGERLPAGRHVNAGELRAMFDACDLETPSGARQAGLLAVLFGCGLRRAEAAGLAIEDYTVGVDGDTDVATLVVRGKGRKERSVYLNNGAKLAVDSWLAHRGDAAGALFCPVRKGGAISHERNVTPQAIRDAVARIARRAGVSDLAPHDARRTFISDMLDAGVDLPTVQSLAGHADPRTTSRYDRRGERVKVQAARALHVPFTSGGPKRSRRSGQ